MLKVLILFFVSFSLFSQMIRSPSEVIDIDRIKTLENQYNNQLFSPQEILSKIDLELSKYFEQFRKERLLKETIASVPYDFYNFPLNKIYLLLYVRNSQDIEKSQRIFSPYLYRTFTLKGNIHSDLKQTHLALYSYIQALEYSIPVLDTNIPKKKNIPYKPTILDLQKILNEEDFLLTLNYFDYLDITLGNKNFLEEIENDLLKQNILEFKKEFSDLKKNILTLQKIKKDYYQSILQNSNQKANLEQDYNLLWEQCFNKIENLWNLESNLSEFLKQLQNQYSEIIFRMANLLKEIELKQKERERILNQSSYYRGTGNQLGVNKTLFRNLIGYTRLLELAVRLNPNQLDYLDLLSEQYFAEKNIQNGIAIEKEWFTKAKEDDVRSPKHYIRMISYYIESKNPSLSKEYLEKLYILLEKYPQLQKNIFPEKESENFLLSEYDHFLFFYASFMLNYNFSSKQDIFLDLLDKIDVKIQDLENKNQSTLKEQIFKQKILSHLAKIYRNQKEIDKEIQILSKIYDIYLKLKDLLNEKINLKKQNDIQALELKQQLMFEENSEKNQRLFFLQKIEIPTLEQEIKTIKTVLNSSSIGFILERMAFLFYVKKDLQSSIYYYDLLNQNNDSTPNEKKRALQNIQILKEIQKKGLWKNIYLPENFER